MAKNDLDRFIQSATYEPDRVFYPSSLLSVNRLTENAKGFQSGRILELIGDYQTGKTSLALDIAKTAYNVLFVDAERTFNKSHAEKLGLDIQKVNVARADTAENTLQIIEDFSPSYNVIILDSLPAIVPKEDIEDKGYNDAPKIGNAALLLSRFFKRIVPIIDTHNTLLILINQFRANISTLSRSTKKPYGLRQLGNVVTWRIELERIENAEKSAVVRATSLKNKLGVERKQATYTLIHGQGFDVAGDTLALALEYGILQKSGAWYTYEGARAQGMEKAKELFPIEEIYDRVKQCL